MTSASGSGVHLKWPAVAALALVSAVGLVAFGWPLLADSASTLGSTSTGSWLFIVLLPLLIVVLLAEIAGGGVDAKAIALLGVLSAVGAAMRPLGGITGFQPMFVLLILGGRVLGPGFGFVLGSVTMFSSALLTGGVGPWLPFQMLGGAWVGLFAGLLPRSRGRAETWLLAAYGAVSAMAFGLLLDLWNWPYTTGLGSSISFQPGAPLHDNLGRFAAYYFATSLGWDLTRAIGSAVLLLLFGAAALRALRRASRRAAFGAAVEFQQPPAVVGTVA